MAGVPPLRADTAANIVPNNPPKRTGESTPTEAVPRRPPIAGSAAHRARDLGRRAGGRRHRRSAGQPGRGADRPDRPARPDAVVAAEGPHRTGRDRRADRHPRGRRGDRDPGRCARLPSAASTTGSSPRAAACTRPCTTIFCGSSAASFPTTTSRSPRWPGCRLDELPSRLAYADERRLAEVAGELIQTLHTDGPGALPPAAAQRRRGAGAKPIPTPAGVVPTSRDQAGRTVTDPGSEAPGGAARLCGIQPPRPSSVSRCRCWPASAPPAAAGEPGAARFLEVRIDRVTPEMVTTTGDADGHRHRHRDQRRRPAGARHRRAARACRGCHVAARPAHQPRRCHRPVPSRSVTSSRWHPSCSAARPAHSPVLSGAFAHPRRRSASTSPASTRCSSTSTAHPTTASRRASTTARFLLPVLGVPADSAVTPGATRWPTSWHPTPPSPSAVTMLWPLADRPRLAPGVPGGVTPGTAGGRRAGGVARARRPAGHSVVRRGVRHRPGGGPGGPVSGALCLAVDPDLLVTVNAMTAGYVVVRRPDGPQFPHPPGRGPGGRGRPGWTGCAALASRMCVAPTPYAQADLGRAAPGRRRRVGQPSRPTAPATSSTRSWA